jgi:5'-nucleotidase
MLEHGVADVESRDGAFLQISGGTYRYNPKKSPGERIISVKVGDDNLEDDKKYTIALPDYILRGGNDFTMLSEAEILVSPADGKEDVDIFIQHCREIKTIDVQLENRIIIEQD